MNGLVIEAALRPKEVQLVRAYASYWRQAGCRFSLRYIADCLRKQPAAVRTLVEGFETRFNPELSADARAAGTAALLALKKTLSDINHADTEDILRSYANLMLATLRTSYFQDTQIGDTIILKFDSSHLALLPEPRPYREIYVFSRRFEGVHLRGGPVARGGLRWSDRMEDYRTEVLGLVKAQMVKNAVIVPAGAKGGSNGYDHKKLGITAKGAWEAVKRHFYESGHDLNTTPITLVGVGDMSGDVFGNGVLLSRQLKLIAAFDHRHIFIDPNPDVDTSFSERERMFALPRSSWEDYDKNLISQGGGVWPRSARSIELSPEARAALGTDAESLSPEQLLHTILLAPVDLFYNGGIGTYIKASSETHAQVKDRANDAIRVDGSQLRCKVVAEGGNLGATQPGRIEFAMVGGRIFTDAIDNSAGVDCSDHEVNVKIWLDTEVNDGNLSENQRNRILTEITADIEALVLRDNTLQTHLLAREEQAQADSGVLDAYAALITELEGEAVLSRELEQLPSDAELMRRKAQGRGLTAPELAVVIANVKNRYKRLLAAESLTGFSWAKTLLTPYFPDGLVASREALEHPLANAILATVLANESVNRCGPLILNELARTHSVSETAVILAWAQAWAALTLAPVFATLDAHALRLPLEVSKALDRRTRVLQRAVIDGVLSVPGQPGRDAAAFAELSALFSQAGAAQQLSPVAHGQDDVTLPADFRAASDSIAALLDMADFLFAALSVTRPASMSLPDFLRLGMELRSQTGIDRLERVLMEKGGDAAKEGLRLHALQALRRAQGRLLMQALQNKRGKPAGQPTFAPALSTAPTLEQAVLEAWTISEAAMQPAAA